MNLFASSPMPCLSEWPASRAKSKRKGRRGRTVPSTLTCNEPSCFLLRDQSHWKRRVPRGALNEMESAVAKRGSKRRTNAFKSKGEGKSLRSTSVASFKGSPTNRETQPVCSALRQRFDEKQGATEAHPCRAPRRATIHATASATMPFSPRRTYRNLSAGVNAKARGTSLNDVSSRPPSRQRHAFPTHLIDTNAFDAIPTTARSRRNSNTVAIALSQRKAMDPCSPLESQDRPPSRYMVKAKRTTHDASGVARREWVGTQACTSSNQAHHDPKTDGFADVDESIPFPFHIQVTTFDSSMKRQVARVPTRHLQEWPGSNQEPRHVVGMGGHDARERRETHDGALRRLQWLDKDDQMYNAHLFETVITLASPRLASEATVTMEDEFDDADNGQGQNFDGVQSEPQEQEQEQERFETRRGGPGHRTQVDEHELDWIRPSWTRGGLDSCVRVDYDSMDPEVAIEQTPLYPSEDLMTLPARELTDLHLDDLSALHDGALAPHVPLTTARLRTSLGMDFLSLFAQH